MPDSSIYLEGRFEAARDLQAMLDLLVTYRCATSLFIYPTTWRLRLFLSSRVWNPDEDIRLWYTQEGHLVGWALFWRRNPDSPYLAMELVLHPDLNNKDLAMIVLAWSRRRAQQVANQEDRAQVVYMSSLLPIVHAAIATGETGYVRVPPDPKENSVYLAYDLPSGYPPPGLPEGYSFYRLQSEADLQAYEALYGFTSVDAHHRQELLHSPEYNIYVVLDPQGQFAAYCEISYSQAEWRLSGRHIAWIDYLGTGEAYQRKGLARALLLHCLGEMHHQGAQTAMLVTNPSNDPAIALYRSLGFFDHIEPGLGAYKFHTDAYQHTKK